MRLTKRVFHDLAIWMVGFGLSIGIGFPFFILLLNVPIDIALTPSFFGACLGAGTLTGCLNFVLARGVVGKKIRLLADRMARVGEELRQMTYSEDFSNCTPEHCSIVVDSHDEIGDSAAAFNDLVAALAASMRTQSAVRSFTRMLGSRLELDTVAGGALDHLLEHTGTTAGAFLVDAGGSLEVRANRGLKQPELIVDNDHVRNAVRSGAIETLEIPGDVEIDGALVDFRPKVVVFVPITHKNVPLGVVVLAATEQLDSEVTARLDLFRHALSLALNNALAHDRLQRLAALDPLTGVYNRRFGLARLHEEFVRAVRAGSPVGLLMIDIDHFKSVNDTYGHLVGDRLLTSIAAVIGSILREGDVLIRYGGEEFLAILPAAACEDLRAIAERLRRSVEDSSLQDGRQTIRATISIGGAAYPNQSVDSEEALVDLADTALYAAKQSGRNRSQIADEAPTLKAGAIGA